jgi:hypothetical protein
MDNISRRALVAGGTLATAALAAGWWARSGAELAARDGVTVVPGGRATMAAATAPVVPELARLVGQAVRIGGEGGLATATIAAITPLPTRGRRPAGVRAVPYRMTLLAPRAGAPEGDKTYALGAPIDGMDRLHLVRGLDQGDQAVLIAVVA